MALVLFSWVDSASNAHSLLLDASPSRTHTTTAQVTEHPVEKGPPVTDYIRPMPRRLTVEGFITNTPIGAPPVHKARAGSPGAANQVLRASASDVGGGAGINAEVTRVEIFPKTTYASFIRGPRPPYYVQALDFLETFDRVSNSFNALVEAVGGGALFTIATSLDHYTNMAATSFTVSESTMGADALSFTIEFQELRIVSTQVVAVPVRKKIADVGTKVPASADADAGKKKALQSTLSATVSGPDAP